MGHHSKKPPPAAPAISTKEKLKQIKKERKLKLKEKRARLIVRNLPFQATEENLKQHFEKFGEIDSVQVLKKEDGLMVGCGFVQFKLVQKAAKAKHHTDDKEFLGRKISVDFALAKNKYKKNKVADEVEVKDEPEEGGVNDEIKEEPIEIDEFKDEPIAIDDGAHVKNDEEIDVKEDNEDESSDSEDDIKEEEEVEEEDNKSVLKRPHVESNDVNEGKTIFIKNVPFSATNDNLKECMWQFGPVYYALICVDKFTEHSKGTAFVKFVNQEDAEKALSAGTELTLLGNILDCHKALGRNEVHQKAQAKQEAKDTPKDSRNLYLVKEGVILAGSKSAEGVSASDMAKRLQLEQYKTQMLRNLNMFVSRDRLVIHNLPSSWDDKNLRTLLLKYSPKNSVIKEVRIMRDLKNVDDKGLGKSKEFGFVSFARHEDAIYALRALNNNPNIFSSTRRPIVAFSIENKSMIKAKQKRLEKSRLKNPKSKQYDPSVVKADELKQQHFSKQESGPQGKFVGVAAKPGVPKMRSRYNLKTQAQIHSQTLKKEKQKKKFAKKSFTEKKEDFTKQPKQKVNNKVKKSDKDNFSKMVADYKKKILAAAPAQKTNKWYDG